MTFITGFLFNNKEERLGLIRACNTYDILQRSSDKQCWEVGRLCHTRPLLRNHEDMLHPITKITYTDKDIIVEGVKSFGGTSQKRCFIFQNNKKNHLAIQDIMGKIDQ